MHPTQRTQFVEPPIDNIAHETRSVVWDRSQMHGNGFKVGALENSLNVKYMCSCTSVYANVYIPNHYTFWLCKVKLLKCNPAIMVSPGKWCHCALLTIPAEHCDTFWVSVSDSHGHVVKTLFTLFMSLSIPICTYTYTNKICTYDVLGMGRQL